MSAPATPPTTSTRRLPRLVLCAVCGLLGVGGGFGVRLLRPSPVAVNPDDQEHDEHDEHTTAEPPPTPEQLRERLDVAVQSGDYDRGLALVHDLLDDDAENPELRYREALCLEGLDRWDDAERAYKGLGKATATVGERVVAAFGLARCRLHADDVPTATALLAECDRLAGHLLIVRSELAFLRARVAVGRVPQPAPGPFAPKAVAWRPIELTADRYLTWLSIASASVFSSGEVEAVQPAHPEPTDAEQAIAAALDQPALHPAAPRLRLASANLAFRDDRLAEAVRGYRALLADSPHGEDGLAVGYNLGLALIRIGSPSEARAALLRAVDRDPKHLLSALGWWWLGRIGLDLGDTDDALTKWYSIDHTDRAIGSAVALGEAVVHALNDDDERAGKALVGVKIAVATPHPELAEAFACWERFSRTESEIRGNYLADAIRAADYGRGFGPAGTYLMGRWLTACGREAKAAAVYDAATERPGGVWAVRMTHAVGEHLYRAGYTARAKTKFTAVAAADAGPVGDTARMRLAEIAVRDGDGDTCVRICRGLLARDPADRDDLLRLMGRGYELLGRHRDAADCFAGRTPR